MHKISPNNSHFQRGKQPGLHHTDLELLFELLYKMLCDQQVEVASSQVGLCRCGQHLWRESQKPSKLHRHLREIAQPNTDWNPGRSVFCPVHLIASVCAVFSDVTTDERRFNGVGPAPVISIRYNTAHNSHQQTIHTGEQIHLQAHTRTPIPPLVEGARTRFTHTHSHTHPYLQFALVEGAR